jgi:methanogenic corrinoid protein MtbC1
MNPTKEDLIDRAKHAVMDLDENAVEMIASEALEAGINPVELIEQGFIEGMKAVGDLFEEGNSQLAQIFEASHIVESGVNYHPVNRVASCFILLTTVSKSTSSFRSSYGAKFRLSFAY